MPENHFEPSPDARFTLFHVFWVFGTLGCSFFTWLETPRLGTVWRALLTIAAGVVGFVVVGALIAAVVIGLVVPYLARRGRRSSEVEGYMAFMLGMEWTNAGRLQQRRD